MKNFHTVKILSLMKSTKQSILFHRRPIIDLKFHPDGDIFFAASKDSTASMMNLNGTILGSFEKHEGSISTLASFENSLMTCGMDLSVFQWDIISGEVNNQYKVNAVIRGIDYGKDAYFCTDNSMNCESFIGLIDTRSPKFTKLSSLEISPTKIFKRENDLIFADIEGNIYKLDLRTNNILMKSKEHQAKIVNIKPSFCRTFFITASEDLNVKIIDSDTFTQKKKFECDEPINCACIFPTNDKIIAVGGINARDVTTTKGKGTFETNFFDIITQKKIGSFKTHFGTINTVDIHPQGEFYCSGGEDGSVCLIKFGDDFKKAPFTKFF